MTVATTPSPIATIRSPHTGALLGGRVTHRHNDGDVTISFAGGIALRGIPLTHAEILSIEADDPSSQ